MHKLNPHDAIRREQDLKLQKERNSKRAVTLKEKRKSPSAKKAKKERKAKHLALSNGLVQSYQDALNVLQKEENLGVMGKKGGKGDESEEESDQE